MRSLALLLALTGCATPGQMQDAYRRGYADGFNAASPKVLDAELRMVDLGYHPSERRCLAAGNSGQCLIYECITSVPVIDERRVIDTEKIP